jgi:hypothetical protein
MGGNDPLPKQVIIVGHSQVELPPGVRVTDWALERTKWQNPRLRCILYCLQALEVLDSSYFLLHCSEAQLRLSARRVADAARSVHDELAPLLVHASCIPALDEARRNALDELQDLEQTTLPALFGLSAPKRSWDDRARRQLATASGRLHGFLQGALGAFMAADPRSRHDADYFLSRRFARHVHETEMLYSSVCQIADLLKAFGPFGPRALVAFQVALEREADVFDTTHWKRVTEFIGELVEQLVPKMQALLVMPGIRFMETKALDHVCQGVLQKCAAVMELQRTAALLADRAGPAASGDLAANRSAVADYREVLARQTARLLGQLETLYGLLCDFVGPWQRNLERRRALMLLSSEASPDPS